MSLRYQWRVTTFHWCIPRVSASLLPSNMDIEKMLANCHYLNRHGVLQGLQTICGLKTLTRIVSFFELILKISIIDAHLLRSWIFQCDPTPAPDIQTFREMGGMENLRWEQVSLIVGHQFNDHIILMWSQEEHKGRKISKLPSP